MKKVLLIPDTFKGTMSSADICSIMKKAILKYFPYAEVISIPVADGGEGTVDSFLAASGGKKISVTVKGPYSEEIESFYGILPDNTAIIEMAAAAGLPLVGENKHPEKASTYGVGQLIEHAVKSGCKKIILGLGGSATNDGGTGAAAALGVLFRDESGNEFIPNGATLNKISTIDINGINPILKGVELITMCDIDNPLCGPNGAAAVFGPQKGADEEMVKFLDSNLAHLAKVVKDSLGLDIAEVPGAGAAGGMGAGMISFFGSGLQMGIETILDTVQFDSMLNGADLVISGEGKFDSQSMRGKVVIGAARRAKKEGVPLIAVVGDIGDDIEEAYSEGVSAIFSINRTAAPYSEARLRARSDLGLTMENLMRFMSMIDDLKNLK